MNKLYCVMIRFKTGRIGFHSTWENKKSAEQQCFLRNYYKVEGSRIANCDIIEYFLEEKTPSKTGHSTVWFENSEFGVLVNKETPEILSRYRDDRTKYIISLMDK